MNAINELTMALHKFEKMMQLVEKVEINEITPTESKETFVVITVGTEERPATVQDIATVTERMSSLFGGSKGVKLIVVPHLIKCNVSSINI